MELRLTLRGCFLLVLWVVLFSLSTTITEGLSAANNVHFWLGFFGLTVWIGLVVYAVTRTCQWGKTVYTLIEEKLK
jgi:hypothetical protein